MKKYSNRLLMSLWVFLAYIVYILFFVLFFNSPWSEQVIFIFISGSVIFGVNYILYLIDTSHGEFDRKIPFLGLSWYVQFLYTVFSIVFLVLFCVLNLSLKVQFITQIFILVLCLLGFVMMHFVLSKADNVKNKEDYLLEIDSVKSLFVRSSEFIKSIDVNIDLKDELSELSKEYRYIVPSENKRAINIDQEIKKKLESILYDQCDLNNIISSLKSLISERKTIL